MNKTTIRMKKHDLEKRTKKIREQVEAEIGKIMSIKDCKYLLPCGKCDQTNEMCSQYRS